MQLSKKNKSGYVYIITNSAFDGFVKIGVTNNIKNRLRTYQTSSPFRDYKIEYYIYHPGCYEAEKKIHEMMKYFATDQKNEWFQIDLEIAKTRLDETLYTE